MTKDISIDYRFLVIAAFFAFDAVLFDRELTKVLLTMEPVTVMLVTS